MNLVRAFSPIVILLFLSFGSVGNTRAGDQQQRHALLIIGSQKGSLADAVQNMDNIARLMKDHGIVVHRFYDHRAKWEDIIQVAQKCQFLVYSGHGMYNGDDSGAGGFAIESYVSSRQIRDEMKLAKNAVVVMQSVCMGAGSSASDDDDIGVDEAKNRVASYSRPFFDIGASAYFAINRVGGSYDFLEYILNGKTLGEAYEETKWHNDKVEFNESYSPYPNMSFVLTRSPGGGKSTRHHYYNGKLDSIETIIDPKGYDLACIGIMDMTFNAP